MYRQGDVLLVPVTGVSRRSNGMKNVRKKRSEGVILAAGEATGHHHRVREVGVSEYRKGDKRYLFTGSAGGTITHEEHDPIKLPKNSVFEIVQQREYEPVIRDNTVTASERYVYD